MIVQPDFLEHWKTRQLIEMTGDESAPLAVIRLWAHCQNSKRGYFPEMTPAQLASICRWGGRKPACHVALTKAGFVDKLQPKGYAAHEWADHNRQLIQKWEAGKNGGRPKNDENPNESKHSGKPTDNRPITARELDRTDRPEQREQIEKIRPDQMSEIRPDQKDGASASGSVLFDPVGSGSVQGLVGQVARGLTSAVYPEGGEPTLEQIRSYMEGCVTGGGAFADKWLVCMKKRQWKDDKGNPVMNWKPLASSWANGCLTRERTQQPKPRSKPYSVYDSI